MGRWTPSDTTAYSTYGWSGNDSVDQNNEAPGGFPALAKTVVAITADGDITWSYDNADVAGATTTMTGDVEAWDGSAWQTVFSFSEGSLTQGASDNGVENGPWTLRMTTLTDFSDVKLRVRIQGTTTIAGTVASMTVSVTNWYVDTRALTILG